MDIITVLPYAIIVSIIAYCLNRKINVSDKKNIKIKKIIRFVSFVILLFGICEAAVVLEYNLNTRAIVRFATEKILTIKSHYIIGKGTFITLFLSIVTFIYNLYAAKIRAKRLAKEAESVKFEIDNVPEEKPFYAKHHLVDVSCYVILLTITYLITSSLFLNFIAFVAKTYIRYNI